ncbi:MAG: PAS domain S-box protein, partial [Chthoniobacterales bacterium]
CTFANRATSEMTGWPVAELIGKQMHDLLHHHHADGSPYPHHDCPIYSAFRQIQGCRVSGEVFWRRDGSFFHVDYASNPTRENGVVTGAVVTFMDVTERIRAEATLRETQEQQRLLAEAIPQQVWTAQPDGTLDYVNTRVVEYFGRSREKIIGMGWLDLVHPDDVPDTVERWSKALSTGQPYEVEFHLRREDGDYRWNLGRALPLHDANGAIVKWFGTNTDITERKLAEEEREQGAHRARLLAEASALLASSLDYETTLDNVVLLVVPEIADWCIIDLLDAAGEIRGVSHAHVDQSKIKLLKEMNRRYPPRRDDPVGVANVIRSGEPEIFAAIDDDLLRAAAKDEAHFNFLQSLNLRSALIVPLRTGGTTIGALTMVRETEKIFTEQDLPFAQDLATRAALSVENSRLYSAAKRANAAKDHFFAVLTHELRTPLNPVLMTVSAMETDPMLPEIVRADIAMIRRNVELEARLIDDLLDLTRISNNKLVLNRQVVDTHELLDYAVHIVRSDSTISQAPLAMELGATEFHTDGDPARLQQIFWNLLKNAVKFTPASGQVLARTSNPAPGDLLLEVIDNGRGIDPALLPVIFETFQQEKLDDRPSPAGLGLGLAISKALAELHGGRLSVASAGRDQGATFFLRLTTVAPLSTSSSAPPPPDESGARLRILVVEDHETTAAAMVRLLSRRGHAVHIAHSVKTALEIAAQHSFDIVVSDLGLPDGNGFQLMEQLRDRYGLRGIALSGYGMDLDQQQSLRSGFSAHLTKPVDLPRLLRALAEVAAARD